MTTTTKPTPARLTVNQLSTMRGASEVARVKHCVETSVDGHPMGVLSSDAWQYVADLIRDAYRAGAFRGAEDQMRDINTRFTLQRRT